MAGDWIKMRVGLQHGDPHVVRLMSALDADKCTHQSVHLYATVGALHALWCVFDQYSEDGRVSYTPREMDTFLNWQGFTQAMIDIGWLEFEAPNTLTMHNFDAHNGKSAKRRASENKRIAALRTNVRNGADKKRTREEEISPLLHGKSRKGGKESIAPKNGTAPSRHKYTQADFDERDLRKIAAAEKHLSGLSNNGHAFTDDEWCRRVCEEAGITMKRFIHLRELQRGSE